MKKRTEKSSLGQEKGVSVFKSLDSGGIQAVMEEQAKRAALAVGLEPPNGVASLDLLRFGDLLLWPLYITRINILVM